MNRVFRKGWPAANAAVVFVVAGVLAGWGWALLILGIGCFVALVLTEPRRPAVPPKPPSPPACGGIAEGCPVCLVASVALGVMVGDWLSGD